MSDQRIGLRCGMCRSSTQLGCVRVNLTRVRQGHPGTAQKLCELYLWKQIKQSKSPSHFARINSGLYQVQTLKVDTNERSLNKQRPAVKRMKRADRSKEFPFTITEQAGRLQLILSKAYTFLLQSIRVEICLSQKHYR